MQHKGLLRNIFLFYIYLSSAALSAQEKQDLQHLYDELDSLFADESLPDNLFQLADSLLALEAKTSALHLRAGYVSQVVSAGRALGIDQYGFSPAITYFHHSGLLAGITGYWSSEYSPAYYLTNLTLGYSYTHRQKFTFQANHDFYLYNDSIEDHYFNKSLQLSSTYNRKHVAGGIDYAFLYGNQNGHRITGHLNANFKLKLTGFIDAISIMPGAAFQWGNADVLYWRQPRTALTDLYRIIKANGFPLLGRRDYLKLTYLLEQNREGAATFFLKQRDYDIQQINNLFDQYYDGSVQEENTFGFMNFSLSLPVIIRAGRTSLLVNYTYNQPQSLPGEDYSYESNSYFSASFSYLISWVKK
jgi:hypothetical protein